MKKRTVKQEYPRHKDKGGVYLEMYSTLWEPEPGVYIKIGAPTLAKLNAAWNRIEPHLSMRIDKVDHIKVYAHKNQKHKNARSNGR